MKIAAITPNTKHDAMAAVIIEGIYDNGIELVVSDHGNGARSCDVRNDQEFIEQASTADYVWVFWGKGPDNRWPSANRHPRYYLLNQIHRPEITAYIDGSEWTATGYPDKGEMVENPWDPVRKITGQAYEAKLDVTRYKGIPWINDAMLEACRWYFKRECYPEDTLRGVIPLNFGAEKRFFSGAPEKKDIDILCSFGQVYTGLRYGVQNVCQQLKDEGYNIIIDGRLNHKDYLALMSRSHIAISAWGGGNNCMRMWEIMANKTCCFAQRMDIISPHRPIDGYHYVEYSSIEEFERKIRHFLKHKELCLKVGKRAYAHVLNHHTGKARVKYMIDVMQTNLHDGKDIFNSQEKT